METESSYLYNPSRADTETELQSLRNIAECQLGAFRQIVIVGVADMVLWILKTDHLFNTPTHKRVEVEKLLNPIADQVFEQMLQIAQSITDYSTQRSTTHRDRPITTMEDIVTYNLLIQVYSDREKAFDMVLILENQFSTHSVDTQKEMIGDLFELIFSRADCGLLVFIISKLFPDFVDRWDNTGIFYVVPTKTSTNPPKSTFNGSGSEDGEEKVIDTLRVFILDVDVPQICTIAWVDDQGNTSSSGGFEETENELRNVGAFSRGRSDLDDHDQRRRKGNGNGNGDTRGRSQKEGEGYYLCYIL